MPTVVETSSYLRSADIFSEVERADIVSMIAADPECGEVIQGTGGFRKVRVRRGGIGKRGGARVIYILRNERFPIFLIAAYAKNERDSLSKAERNSLAKRADEISTSIGASTMATTFHDLMNGLDEVDVFLAGKTAGYKVTLPAEVDVKRIREELGMTQVRFSAVFGFSLDAVKHWEGGRRTPESAARAFLTVIAKDPGAVLKALHSTSTAHRKAGRSSGITRLPSQIRPRNQSRRKG